MSTRREQVIFIGNSSGQRRPGVRSYFEYLKDDFFRFNEDRPDGVGWRPVTVYDLALWADRTPPLAERLGRELEPRIRAGKSEVLFVVGGPIGNDARPGQNAENDEKAGRKPPRTPRDEFLRSMGDVAATLAQYGDTLYIGATAVNEERAAQVWQIPTEGWNDTRALYDSEACAIFSKRAGNIAISLFDWSLRNLGSVVSNDGVHLNTVGVDGVYHWASPFFNHMLGLADAPAIRA